MMHRCIEMKEKRRRVYIERKWKKWEGEEEEKEQRYGKTEKNIRGETGGEEREDVFRLPAI